jgi:hypothetical protein
MDGEGAVIQYGTGSAFGHTLCALWFEDGLYIVESTGPVVKRTPYAQWMESVSNGNTQYVWLPLKEELWEKFDEEKARAWYLSMEGHPYGFRNFMYGWIDTVYDNYPMLLPVYFLPIFFSLYEKFNPYLAEKFCTSGLNMRLGTTGLDMAGCAAESARQGMSLSELMTIVE